MIKLMKMFENIPKENKNGDMCNECEDKKK